MSHGRHHCNNTQFERKTGDFFFLFVFAVLGNVVLEQRLRLTIDPSAGKNYNFLELTRHFNFPRMRNRPVGNRNASVKKCQRLPGSFASFFLSVC